MPMSVAEAAMPATRESAATSGLRRASQGTPTGAEQQGRQQEPRQHKEDVDAEEATGRQPGHGVVGEHGEEREPPQPVEGGDALPVSCRPGQRLVLPLVPLLISLSPMAGGGLPTGTLTFLFTDLEGSTHLLQRLGDRYPALLAAHYELMRAAFGRTGGREVGTRGDALFVVFEQASAAVAGAADSQLALSGYDWPDDCEVRVRMGLHTGEAEMIDGDYIGMAVNMAARICSAAHGGQVLVSD